MTYNTRHALGSSDARDLKDNAVAIDYFANGPEEFYPNRFGEPSKSIKGLQKEVSEYLLASGFEPVHLIYNPGTPLSVARSTQAIDYSGSVYSVKMPATFPVALTGVWATDSLKLKEIGDQALRQSLAGSSGATMVSDGTRSVSDKLSDTTRLQDQVPAGNGVADDLAKVNAAIAATPDGVITTRDQDYRVSARPTNPLGARFRGKGRILLDTGLGPRQLNTYSDDLRLHRGREYLSRLFVRMVDRGQLKLAIVGDSTMAGGNGEPDEYLIHKWMAKAFADKGYSNVAITNAAEGGTGIQDMNAIPLLGPTLDGLFIGYGTNNAGPTQASVDFFLSTLESKVAEVRGNENGKFANLAIIIVGPNATNDIPHGRDYRFYEKIHWGMVEISKKWQCSYYNRYGECPDADNMAGNSMDDQSTLGAGVAVHLLAPGIASQWGGLMDWAFPQSSFTRFRNNATTNNGAASGIPLEANPATSYPPGNHMYRVNPENGWPDDGMLQHDYSVDGACRQVLSTFGARAKAYSRTWVTGGGYWTAWTGKAYQLVLGNGWAEFGSNFPSATVTLQADGVHALVVFAIKSGATAALTAFGQVPSEMNPKFVQLLDCITDAGGSCRARLKQDGTLLFETPGNAVLTTGSFLYRVAD